MISILLFCGIVSSVVGSESCFLNGEEYEIGQYFPSETPCFEVKCTLISTEPVMADWNHTGVIYEDCRRCDIYADPHFITLDQLSYEYQGQCNYTMTQSLDWLGPEESYEPEFGVFSEFKTCSGDPSVTCADSLVFQDSLHSVITVDFSSTLPSFLVNGGPQCNSNAVICHLDPSPTFHSVVFWQHSSSCWRFQGINLAVQVCSESRLWTHIYAHPQHIKHLNGLCGYFTGDNTDEFYSRQRNQEPLTDFADSWKTDDQTKRECMFKHDEEPEDFECSERDEHYETCKNLLSDLELNGDHLDDQTLNTYIEDCVFDLCRDPDNIEKWLLFYQQFGLDTIDIEAHTRERRTDGKE